MPEPRRTRRRRRVTPRHGRPPQRRGLRARRFGPLSLTLAAVLGTGAGMGVATAVVPVVVTVPVAAQAPVTEPTSEPAPEPVAPVQQRAGTALDTENLTPSSLGGSRSRVPPSVPMPLRPPEPLVLEDRRPVEEADPDALDADGLSVKDRAAGLLSRDVPPSAEGTLTVVAGSAEAPHPDRTVRTIRVEVEDGLAVDADRFADTVMKILNDPRGWGADGSVSFARTDGDADLRVVLASQGLTDEMCSPLETVGLYSCGTRGHAVLNHMRWVEATEEFEDRAQYRQYLVNHEVGHLLGHGHDTCSGEGAVAPIMQQQTIEVAPCEPNGWPFPDEG